MDNVSKWDKRIWLQHTFCDFLKRGKPSVPIVEYSYAEADTKWTVGWQLWRKIDGEWIDVNERLHAMLEHEK